MTPEQYATLSMWKARSSDRRRATEKVALEHLSHSREDAAASLRNAFEEDIQEQSDILRRRALSGEWGRSDKGLVEEGILQAAYEVVMWSPWTAEFPFLQPKWMEEQLLVELGASSLAEEVVNE